MILNLIRHWFFGHYTRRVTRKGVRRLIRNTWPNATGRHRREVLRQIDHAAESHAREELSLATDPPSVGHLEWASFILAAYRKLLPEFGSPEQMIESLGAEMNKAHATPMILFTLDRLMKAFQGDVHRARKVFDAVLKQYGAFFTWNMDIEKSRLTITITRCWYFHSFAIHNVPRLTICACRLDGLWFNRMKPERHGLRFDHDRYTTKGYGEENCVFTIEQATDSSSNPSS